MKQRLSSCIVWSLILFLNVSFVLCRTLTTDEEVEAFLNKFTGNESVVNLDTWEAPLEMQKTLAYYLSGFDDENRPIWVAEWGKWDVKKYVDAGGEDLKSYDQYVDQQMVRMLRSMKLKSTPENPVKELVFIIDAEGYPLAQLASGTVIYNLRKFASWRAMLLSLSSGYIVNTNFLAERMVNLVKPVLGATFEKFEVYGTNKSRWFPRILKNIPRDQLPEWYGGAKDFTPAKVYGR